MNLQAVTYEQLAATIDHSLLRPELTVDEVLEGCALADRYRVASVCVRPADVRRAAARLADSPVEVGTVIGFPHGANATQIKAAEARLACDQGAGELDVVLNIGWLRSGLHEDVQADISAVVEASGDALVKVILENAYLHDEQKVRGCELAEAAGADFVKTSTGFAPSGSTIEDLKLMRASVSADVQVKAAGGVRTLDDLLMVMSVGVTRIGATRTASILDDYRTRSARA